MPFEQQQQDDPLTAAVKANLAEDARAEQERLKVAGASTVSPDKAAEGARIQQRFGLPASFVERNYDNLKKQIDAEDLAQKLQTAPALKTAMQDPSFATAAKDDVDTLHTLERSVSFGEAIARGVDTTAAMGGAFLEATGELVGADALAARGRGIRQRNTLDIQKAGAKQTFMGIRGINDLGQYLTETVGEMIPIMAPSLAGAAAGGEIGALVGTAVPLPVVGTVSGATIGALIGAFIPAFALGVGETQMGIKEADPNLAAPATAFLGGSAIAAFDTALPGHVGSRLVKAFGTEVAEEVAKRALTQIVKPKFFREVAKETVHGLATEGVTEAIQEAIGAVAVAQAQGKPIGSVFTPELAVQMIEAGVAGAVMGGTTSGVSRIAEQRALSRRAVAAEQQQLLFQALAQGAIDSKLIARLPEAAKGWLQSRLKEGPIKDVFIDADTFTEYFQGRGENAESVAAKVTGDPEALAKARANNEPLRIPTAAYAVEIAGSEHHGALEPDLRLGTPAAMSRREAVTYRAKVLAEMQAAKDSGALDEVGQVRQALVAQFMQGAKMSQAQAERQTALYEAGFVALSRRKGVTLSVLELYNRYGLKVQVEKGTAAPAAETPAGGPAAAPAAAPGEDLGQSSAPAAEPQEAAPGAPGEAQGDEGPPAGGTSETPVPRPPGPWDANVDPAVARGIGQITHDPNAPINAMADIGAAAARMMAENPNIMREAAELRARSQAARKPAPPREPKTPGQQALVDLTGVDPDVLGALPPPVVVMTQGEAVTGAEGEFPAALSPAELLAAGDWLNTPQRADISELVAEIRREGIREPVVMTREVTDDGTVVEVLLDGHETVRAAAELGLSSVPVIWRDQVTGETFEEHTIILEQAAAPADKISGQPAAEVRGVEDARQLPFPSIDEAQSLALLNARDKSQVTTQAIPLEQLVATQSTFSESVARDYQAGTREATEPVEAVEHEGRFYLLGGTHRAVAAWAAGETTIEADVTRTTGPVALQPTAAVTLPHGATAEQSDTGESVIRIGDSYLELAVPTAHTDVAGESLPEGFLYVMDVAAAPRREGIGRRLYEAALVYAKQQGYQGISSTDLARNDQSEAVWAALKRDGQVTTQGAYDLLTGLQEKGGDEFFQEPAPVRDPRELAAIALYKQRGGGGSVVRMAVALREQGIRPATRTKAERIAANAYVDALVQEADRGEEFFQAASKHAKEVRGDMRYAPARYQNGGRIIFSSRVPWVMVKEGQDAEAIMRRNLRPRLDVLQTDLSVLKEPEAVKSGATERYADAVRALPLLTEADLAETADNHDAAIERGVQRMVRNLRWLWDQFDDATRNRAKLWYVGAHRIANELAAEYQVAPRQAAGVLAVLSPQMDWFKNVDLARRVFKAYDYLEHHNPKFTDLFRVYRSRIENRKQNASGEKITDAQRAATKALLDAEEALWAGKRWKELDAFGRAHMLREWDQVHIPRQYQIITPEGDNAGHSLTDAGVPERVSWGTYPQIANAVSLLMDGSEANIDRRIGREHKVRSFYNNISDPDHAGFVTIDVHAIAAAYMLPLSGTDPLSIQVMGGSPTVPAAGLSGMNPVVAEAYNRLARELGVLPREVQSVTWEAARSLFPESIKKGAEKLEGETVKTTPIRREINRIFGQFRSGKISEAVYRRQVMFAAAKVQLEELAEQLRRGEIDAATHNARVLVATTQIRSPHWGTRAAGDAVDEGRLPAVDVWSRGRADLPPRRRDAGADPEGARGQAPVDQDRILGGGDAYDEFFQSPTTGSSQPFYSRLTRAVEASPQGRASGAQWKATIRNAKTGVNLDEFTLANVTELDDKQTYTRQQVLDFLDLNRVVVEVVKLGEPIDERELRANAMELQDQAREDDRREAEPPDFSDDWPGAQIDVNKDETGAWVASIDGDEMGDSYDTAEEAEEAAQAEIDANRDRWNDEREREWWSTWESDWDDDHPLRDFEESAAEAMGLEEQKTHYGDYRFYPTDPAIVEDSYRETFLTAPKAMGPQSLAPAALSQEELETLVNAGWSEELASMERMSPEWRANKASTIIAEIESNITEFGYKGAVVTELRETQALLQKIVNDPSFVRVTSKRTWQDGHEDYWMIKNPIVRLRYDLRAYSGPQTREIAGRVRIDPRAHGDETQLVLFVHEIQPPQAEEQTHMPELFLKNWRELGIKYALREAVELGATHVAWTTGQMQIDLYPSIEQEVKRISWSMIGDERHVNIFTRKDDGQIHIALHPNGTVRSLSSDTSRWEGAPLENVIGKELTEKILADERGRLEGEGLKIGGTGLRKLYDKDLPAVAGKIVKKAAGKVEALAIPRRSTAVLSTAERWRVRQRTNPAVAGGIGYQLMRGTQDVVPPVVDPVTQQIVPAPVEMFSSFEEAQRQADRRNEELHAEKAKSEPRTVDVPAIAITPELKTQVLGGQAYFQADAAQGEDDGRPRGSLRIAKDTGQMTITLFDGRWDESTIVHEGAHMFLRIMEDLAADSPEIAADLETIRQWAPDATAQPGGRMTRYQHEQFARGFELYMREGTAPSLGLRAVFHSFKLWLLDIYKSARDLNVTINDDVRGVFDRMLATEEAIAEVHAVGNLVPLFTDAAAAGMSDAEFMPYQALVLDAGLEEREKLEQRLMAELKREQTRAYKEKQTQVLEQVAQEVNQRPVYRALALMQKGTEPDGSPVANVDEPIKLSRTIITARYGIERLKAAPRGVLAKEGGGVDPDAVAQRYGYGSGDELLAAITDAPPRRQVVLEETKRRMEAEYPSLMQDRAQLLEAAQESMGDAREKVIKAELAALHHRQRLVRPHVRVAEQAGREALAQERKERAYERRYLEAEQKLANAIAAGKAQEIIDAIQAELSALKASIRGAAKRMRGAIPDDDTFRLAAKTRLQGTVVRNVNPQVFWSAARKSSTIAAEKAARQDLEGAIAAKHQELLNLALFREATRIKRDVEARVKRARALSKTAARERLGKAGGSYLEQVEAILERFEFTPITGTERKRRASLINWVEGLQSQGLPADLPEALLNEALRANYAELTYQELVDVTDGLQQIVHLSRVKNKLLQNKKTRDLQKLVQRLVTSINDNAGKPPRKGERDRRPEEEQRRLVSDFFASHRKLANILREFDGWEDGGPMWEAIMLPLNQAGAREASMNAQATRQLHDLVEAAFPGAQKSRLYEKTEVPAIKQELSLMQRLIVAMNYGSEGNRERMMRAEGWSEDQLRAIVETLSRKELVFVQGVVDHINSYWEQIAAKQRRVTGLAPEKVAAIAWETPNGVQRGGYFPLKYDDRLNAKAIQQLDLNTAELAKSAAYTQATTQRGHTKGRVEITSLPVRHDFGVIFEHVGQVIHDLTHHEALVDVSRILGHPEVSQAIIAAHGDILFKQIRNTIRDVAFGDVPATGAFERVINHIRVGSTVVGLGWNFVTSALQPLGLFNSMHRIGVGWVGKGVGRWIRNPTAMVETVKWVRERSEFMATRGLTQQREINEIRNSLGMGSGRLTGWVDQVLDDVQSPITRHAIADSYFSLIAAMQTVADIPTWLGMYEKQMAAGVSEQRAVELADQAVLDSQGGGQIKDLAGIQRGGPMLKLWTNFYSFFNVLYNQAAETKRRTQKDADPAAVGRAIVDYALLFLIPATLGYFMRQMFRKTHDDDDDPEKLAKHLLVENLSYISGTMLGVREVSSVFQGTQGYEGPAGARFFSSLSRAGTQYVQGEVDVPAVRATAEVVGALMHLPSGQVMRSILGTMALMEGETTNPWAVVAGPPPKNGR